jgi:transcriptional regulator with XRE-family HTH domain
VARKAFHEILISARQNRGFAIETAAKKAGVSESEYSDFETGKAVPTKAHLRAIFGSNNALEAFLPVGTPAAEGLTRATPPPLPERPNAPKTALGIELVKAGLDKMAPPAPSVTVATPDVTGKPFSEALFILREDAGMSQADLAAYIGVHAASVYKWESGENVPVMGHMAELVKCFPALEKAKAPAHVRDSSKPGPATGSRTGVASPRKPASPPPTQAATKEPPPKPAQVAATPILDPLSAIDALLMAYDKLGQPIDFKHARQTDGTYKVRLFAIGAEADALAEGAGPSMHAAALAMITSLRTGMTDRVAQTKRIVENATARLASQEAALHAIEGAIGA